MTAPSTIPPAQAFGDDQTVRWSCRAGEYVLWVGTDCVLVSDRPSAWNIRDFWQMRDGDCATITNRWTDLPVWFELHPEETANRAAFEMMKRLKAGYRPAARMEGPNIWRAKAGDRLVWVTTKDPRRPIREILDLRSCVLAIGENSTPSFDLCFLFGAPQGNEVPPGDAAAVRAGFNAAVGLGVPIEFAPEWRFGA